jgi:sRNA-binding regulator protein Hfq
MKIKLLIIIGVLFFLSACKPVENILSKFFPQTTPTTVRYVCLYLKSGIMIQGRFMSETDDYYFVEWKGKEVRFKKDNIVSIKDVTAEKTVAEETKHNAERVDTSHAVDSTEIKSDGPILVQLFLKTGDVISGILEQELNDEYMINYEGGIVGFSFQEVEKIVRSDKSEIAVIRQEENEVFHSNANEEQETGPATIYMKNGSTLKCSVLNKIGRSYTIDWDGDTVQLVDDEIEKIVYEKKSEKKEYVIPEGARVVIVHLPDQSTYSGILIEESENTYVIQWKGQRVEFDALDVTAIDDCGTPVSEATVTLYLINGGAISGELIDEDETHVVMKWHDAKTVFKMDEIERIERGKALKTDDGIIAPQVDESLSWTYENDVVLKLLNGEVLDVEIHDITADVITFRESFKEGGYVEQEVPLSKLDYLMFKPIVNERSTQIEKSLSELFPDMRFYRDGNTTIITDSYVTAVNNYKRVIRQIQTETFCQFFYVFKDKKQDVQHFVVVFDKSEKWIEFTMADGVPGWIVPGYFSPVDKVLYLYNWLGDEVQEFVTSMMEEGYGKNIDLSATSMKGSVDQRYHMQIDESAKNLKDLLWSYFDWQMNGLKQITNSVLRHEFAHGIFSNWGIQMVVVSKVNQETLSNLEKKKEFLKSSDISEKKKIILDLMTQRSTEDLPEINAANSWCTEGIATFCETSPLGGFNKDRIYGFQELMRNNALLPLEQLSAYKIGSFPGVYQQAMLDAYSQSWALVCFLMDKYRQPFLTYLIRVSNEQPEGNQDIVWLEEALGKNRRVIEQELVAYMEQFEDVDDPTLTLIEKNRKFQDDVMTFMRFGKTNV